MAARLSQPEYPEPSLPRYSAQSFPPYHYVPTLNPHPCANPLGHSYAPPGTPPHRPPLMPPERWSECETYRFGVDLHNFAYWWEAHETWESIWQASDKAGPQGRFLQGLIQVSAAHLKRHMSEAEGVLRLLERARSHLDFVQRHVPSVYMGLDLPDFRQRVESYFGDPRPSAYPFIRLHVL